MKRLPLTTILFTTITTLFFMTGPALGQDSLYVDPNGNVGIGTSPSQQLHVSENIRTDGRYVYFGDTQYIYGDNEAILYYG